MQSEVFLGSFHHVTSTMFMSIWLQFTMYVCFGMTAFASEAQPKEIGSI